MPLVTQLFLAELVKCRKLLALSRKIIISDRCQLDLDDDVRLRNHHCDTSEQHFEVLRKFLSACVSWIIGDEVPSRLDQLDLLCTAWERKHP